MYLHRGQKSPGHLLISSFDNDTGYGIRQSEKQTIGKIKVHTVIVKHPGFIHMLTERLKQNNQSHLPTVIS